MESFSISYSCAPKIQQRLPKIPSFSVTPEISAEQLLLWQCGFFHVRIFLFKVNFGKAVWKKKSACFSLDQDYQRQRVMLPRWMVQGVIGLVLKQTLCSGCCWASVKCFSNFPATKGMLKIADRNSKKDWIVGVRLSEVLDSEYLERNLSFPIRSTSWARSLQQLKVTGLSKRKGSSSGCSTHCSGQPKPHLNPHFLLSQSFPSHSQLTKLFPWQQKEDARDCCHLIRAFLALEALEERTFLIPATPKALLNPSSLPTLLLWGTAGDKASPAASPAQIQSQADPHHFEDCRMEGEFSFCSTAAVPWQ